MKDTIAPKEIRQKMAQHSIFWSLVSFQLDEIDAQKALQNVSAQYIRWEKSSLKERRKLIGEHTKR